MTPEEIVNEALWKVANTARREVTAQIYEALKRRRDEARTDGQRGWPLLTEAMVIAREIGDREIA